LGIAVFGFLYKFIFPDLDPTATLIQELPTNSALSKALAAFGILMFGISAVGALVFRYFATEGARFYIEALRCTPDRDRAKESLDKRHKKILVCRWSKAIAALTLASGGVLVAVALFLLLIK